MLCFNIVCELKEKSRGQVAAGPKGHVWRGGVSYSPEFFFDTLVS